MPALAKAPASGTPVHARRPPESGGIHGCGPTRPLGLLPAPDRGWLTLLRHHYWASCPFRTRAYDLETGAVFEVANCWNESERRPFTRVRAGEVPVQALRETAWFLLLSREIRDLLLLGAGQESPDGIDPPVSEPAGLELTGVGCGGVNDAVTLDYRLQSAARAAIAGYLTLDFECEPKDRLAAKLLGDLEDSFREGCARFPPPLQTLRARTDHWKTDWDSDFLEALEGGFSGLLCRP
jgi:hypothetical protein